MPPVPVATVSLTADPVLLSSNASAALRLTPATPLRATVPCTRPASPALFSSNAPVPPLNVAAAVPAAITADTPDAPAFTTRAPAPLVPSSYTRLPVALTVPTPTEPVPLSRNNGPAGSRIVRVAPPVLTDSFTAPRLLTSSTNIPASVTPGTVVEIVPAAVPAKPAALKIK